MNRAFKKKGIYKRQVKIIKPKKVTALHHAAECGDLNKIMQLLCRGVDINAQDRFGDTALHETVEYGDFECVQLLVREGADVNKKRKDGATALHLAASLGLQDFVTFLFENGADVNAKADGDLTPMHFAASKSQPQMIRLLFTYGAIVNAVSVTGRTALHIAVSKSDDCINVLADIGANIFVKDVLGISPLEVAIELDVFKTLLPQNFNFCSADGTTPVHIASQCMNHLCLEYMIDKGCDVNIENKSGDTPLHFACLSGNCYNHIMQHPFQRTQSPNIELLIKAGADKQKKNKMGLAPVHVCAKNGSLLSLDCLEKFGCDMNLRGGDKNSTPLHFAAESGHLDCIEFLIRNGVDKEVIDSENCTALMLAAKNCHFECVKFLLERGVPLWTI
ncbi:hypothetical protein R5R35_006384 [Gryllus longicercus]|uniref:Uncharacterized protein n=1 Tax=Gryllus longicercus TaxID=2509291 RepID=A0AAN9ZHJ5_9ORTH